MTSSAVQHQNNSTFELYRYSPSIPAAIIFIGLFGALTAIHAFQLYRSKSWFMIPILIGGIFETLGYVGRIISHSNTNAVGPFIMQSLLILLAPALFAASIYMILGRTITRLNAAKYSWVPIKWLTKIFVGGDVLSFLAQSAGGGLMAGGNSSSLKNGSHVIMIGLAIQLLFFGFFIIAAVHFHLRFRIATPANVTRLSSLSLGRPKWEITMFTLYVTSALILIRSIFRLIEYGGGNDGFLMSHEVFLYVFDATLMFGVLAVLAWIHPSLFLDRQKGEGNVLLEHQ